ncbi:non-ribosomal peptide synthetase [Kitasatospora sp. NPDC127059]|uniref:non-ribosomal peptide synthetase n=1 Tax=unclassified Kitasatospora TaxID=2633591 RepID=UPI00365DCBF6
MESLSIGYGRPHQDGAVLDLFTGQAQRTPQAPALIDGQHTYDYAGLDRLADTVATALRGKVGPGDLVGVCLGHSAALVAVTLGIAKLGAVHLPLGPRPGEKRLQAVAEQLRPVCLVGEPAVLPPGGERLALDLPTADQPGAGVVAALTPGGQVSVPVGTHYAVLTSGSTGTPKAVAVTEPALGALLHWYRELTGLGPGERHSLLIGVAFDPHVMELWATLTSGAALVVAPEAVRWDSGALTDWLGEAGITTALLPTPLAEPILNRPWPAGLAALRHLVIGGDRLRRAPGPEVTATVHNAYGPAEATVATTVHTMAPGGDHGAGAPPIGLPIPGAVLLVTDEQGRPVPRGTAGELRIGGRGLAAGYLDPELTARRFVQVPPGVDGTDRVYRTGDRVVMRADGVLEFHGRLDDQVKVSGVRIEPAEVEAAFERDPRVRRAVVAAETAETGVRLLAFVQTGTDTEPGSLLEAVRPWLPEQAVPSAVRLVDTFPLDANGKVDRAALLAAEPPAPEAVGEEGETPVERTVLKLCRELIGRADLGPGDNFLAAGGNSLAAARLLESLEGEYGVRLRAPLLLRQPDLRAVARLVEERMPSASLA